MHVDVALEVESYDPLILIDFMMINVNLSKTRLKETMKKGAVWVTRNEERQRIRRAMYDLQAGDIVEIFYDDGMLANRIQSECVHQNEHYSIWNKPTGMSFYGSDWCDHNSLIRQVELGIRDPDADFLALYELPDSARGLVLFTHDAGPEALLNSLFDEGQIEISYRLEINNQPAAVGEVIDIAGFDFLIKSYNPKSNCSVIMGTTKGLSVSQLRTALEAQALSIVGDQDDEEQLNIRLFVYQIRFLCPFDSEPVDINLYS